MIICARCNIQTNTSIMSMFDTSMICLKCKAEEQNHPMYQQAVEAEMKAVKAGNLNFKGIGYPETK